MESAIYFKFKGQRAAEEKVVFDGMTVSATELKNLIAEKKGLDTSKDTYELLDPKGQQPFPDSHAFVRGMKVLVRRKPLQQPGPRKQLQAGAGAAGEEEEAPNQALVLAQALAAAQTAGTTVADPNDEQAQLEQLRNRQVITDMEAQAVAEAQHTAWQAQTDQHIRQTRQREQQMAQQGRGRGYGRGFGGRGMGTVPPICRYCGAVNAHFPDECPQRHAPRTDLRQVRAPTGIPASYVREDEAGGLLLNSGRTGAVRTNDAEATSIFAALPAAKRAALAAAKAAQVPALTDRPHEPSADDALLQTLLLDIEPADEQQQPPSQQQAEQQQQLSPQQQQDEQQQQPPGQADGVDAMAVDEPAAADSMQQQQPGAAGAAEQPVAAGGGLGGLFDDEDLLPPAAAEGALNLGIGMELDQPAPQQQEQPQQHQQQQQTQPAGSPLGKQLQVVPPKSPVVQAMQQAAPGLQLTDKLAEQLRYSSDILKPWNHWDLKDLVPSFFEPKPLTPDDYAVVLDKYRERRRAALKKQQQQHHQEQQHAMNGGVHGRREQQQHWEDRRHRSRPGYSPPRSPHGGEHGSGAALDRGRSRRERVAEREARDTNRLLRKERERELRHYSNSRSRSRSRGRAAQARTTRARSRSPQQQQYQAQPPSSPGRNAAAPRDRKASKRGREVEQQQQDDKRRGGARSSSRDRSASREGVRGKQRPAGERRPEEATTEEVAQLERQPAKRQRSSSPAPAGVATDGDARPTQPPDLQHGGVSADLRNLLVDSESDMGARPDDGHAAAGQQQADAGADAAAATEPAGQPAAGKASTPRAANGRGTPPPAKAASAAAAADVKAGTPEPAAKRPDIFSRLHGMGPRVLEQNGSRADHAPTAAAAGEGGAEPRGRSPNRQQGGSASRSRSRTGTADKGGPDAEDSEEALDFGDGDGGDGGDADGGEEEGGAGGDGSPGGDRSRKDKRHKKHKKHKKKKRRRERHGDEEEEDGDRPRSRSRSRSRGQRDRSGSRHRHRSRSPEQQGDNRASKRVRSGYHRDDDYDYQHHQYAQAAEPEVRRSGRSIQDRLGMHPAAAAAAAEAEGPPRGGGGMARSSSGRAAAAPNPRLGIWGGLLQKTLSTQGSAEQQRRSSRHQRR